MLLAETLQNKLLEMYANMKRLEEEKLQLQKQMKIMESTIDVNKLLYSYVD